MSGLVTCVTEVGNLVLTLELDGVLRCSASLQVPSDLAKLLPQVLRLFLSSACHWGKQQNLTAQGKFELEDGDEPLNRWTFGETDELFRYRLIGQHRTQSGRPFEACNTFIFN